MRQPKSFEDVDLAREMASRGVVRFVEDCWDWSKMVIKSVVDCSQSQHAAQGEHPQAAPTEHP